MLCVSFAFLCNKFLQAQQFKTMPIYCLQFQVRRLVQCGRVLYLGYSMAKIMVLAGLSSWLEAKGKSLFRSSFLLVEFNALQQQDQGPCFLAGCQPEPPFSSEALSIVFFCHLASFIFKLVTMHRILLIQISDFLFCDLSHEVRSSPYG